VPVASPSSNRLAGWPSPLQPLVRRWLLDARPLVALERLCVFLLVVLFLKNLADYVQALLMVSVEQSAIRDLRARLFEHLHELPLAFFDSRRTGMLVSRITNDLEYLRASLAAGISNLIKDSLTLVVCLAWVFVASWQLALFSLIVLPPVALALVTIGRKMRKRSTRAQERMADMTSILQETIVGARIVKAFGMERFESDRFGRANDGFRDAFVRLRRVSAAARPVSEYAIVVVAVAMLWFGGREIFVNHALAPQQFVLFVTALLSTMSPLKSLSEVNANVQQGIAAADRVFDLLDSPVSIADARARGRCRGSRVRSGSSGCRSRTGRASPCCTRSSSRSARARSWRSSGRAVGQVDDHGSARAVSRPARGPDHVGRHRSPRRHDLLVARAARHRHAGDDPVPRHGEEQHRIRPRRRDGRRDPRCGARRVRARMDRAAAAGLRHGDR
jgi:ABC-type multidrug transport system fused ATPase/permease subunit